MFRSVDCLLRPKSIAIVGASDSSRGGWAQEIYDNLDYCGFPAKIYLVNPKRSELWGRPVYPNFAAIPEPVDLALTIIPRRSGRRHARRSGGAWAQVRADLCGAVRRGRRRRGAQARAGAAGALASKHGLRISGPNCMGSLALREKLLLYPAKRVRTLHPGPVGVVFQSGGTFQFWLQQAALRGLDFSYAVSSGNELDLDLADYINFLVEDEHTKIIACLVEGIRRPHAFMAAAEKALAASKPIVLVKVGRSERGKAAAASHTGAIAGDDAVFDAVCRKYGIVRCPSLDDLMETCLAFAAGPAADGPAHRHGRAIRAAPRGSCSITPPTKAPRWRRSRRRPRAQLPAMIDPGLAAENPLDVGPAVGVQAPKFAEICKVVCADPTVDLVTVQGLLPVESGDPYDPEPLRSVRAVDRQADPRVRPHRAERLRHQPQVPDTRPACRSSRACPRRCARCRALVRYAGALRRGVTALPEPRGRRGRPRRRAPSTRLLAQHGLTAADERACERRPSEAARRSRPHRLSGRGQDRLAAGEPQDRGRRRGARPARCRGGAGCGKSDGEAARRSRSRARTIDGFLVQEMVDGLEMIVGVREDPQFGPFMLVGLGGVLVEVMRDVAIRLLPVDEDDRARDARLVARRAAARRVPRPRRRATSTRVVRAMTGLSRLFARSPAATVRPRDQSADRARKGAKACAPSMFA